jgi:hypothetical protein
MSALVGSAFAIAPRRRNSRPNSLTPGGISVRNTEKVVAVLILALTTWAVLMWAVTGFAGSQSNRILLVELGSDATSLDQAVQANGKTDREGIAHNIQMVKRNTYLDFVFVLLYWMTFFSLAYLAGMLGQRVLAFCSAASMTAAAVADLLENHSILTAMGFRNFTDAVAVDISEYSQAKWAFFFLAIFLLGLAMAMNQRTSQFRRVTGGVFLASGVFGMAGIARCRISFDFAAAMLNVGMFLTAAALLLTLWKIYRSLKELDQLERAQHAHLRA